MHLAREGRAGYNKAMKNYYRIMLGAKSAFAGTHKICLMLEKR
jgi:hypothetical protein